MLAPQPGSIEERILRVYDVMSRAPADELTSFRDRLELSWIYHDSALEGVVYRPEEFELAFSGQTVHETSLLQTIDEIRQHKTAIQVLRQLAEKKKSGITQEALRELYVTLVPEEAENKGPLRYRKDMPLHRLYFHEITTPDKIAPKVRDFLKWVNAAETKRSSHPIRVAAKAHFTLMQIYPFPKHSGKVARLLMNLMLMQQGYPPAIIHATERQRYYDALKTSPNAVAQLIQEAMMSAVDSAGRHFEQLLEKSA